MKPSWCFGILPDHSWCFLMLPETSWGFQKILIFCDTSLYFLTVPDPSCDILTLLEASWQFLMLNEASWPILMITDASRCFLTLLDASICFLTLLETWWHLLRLPDDSWCIMTLPEPSWCFLSLPDTSWLFLMYHPDHPDASLRFLVLPNNLLSLWEPQSDSKIGTFVLLCHYSLLGGALISVFSRFLHNCCIPRLDNLLDCRQKYSKSRGDRPARGFIAVIWNLLYACWNCHPIKVFMILTLKKKKNLRINMPNKCLVV